MIQPVFENEYVKLYHGDCLQIMPQLDFKVDAVIADPPYGTIGKNFNLGWDVIIPFQPMWNELKRLIKPNGAICLFGQQPFSSLLRCSNLKDFRYDWIWKKSHCCNFLCANKQPLKTHQLISVFYEKQPTYNAQKFDLDFSYSMKRKSEKTMVNGRNYGCDRVDGEYTGRFPKSIISFSNGNSKNIHPTQKPVDLMEFLVKTYTNEGDVILDFTAGSGSTGIAAMNLKRKCILIEKELKYVNITIQRFKNHYTQQTIL